jgi:hypothetical protein
MVSGHTGNVVPGNRLRVRVPCPPLAQNLSLQAVDLASLAMTEWTDTVRGVITEPFARDRS